MLDSSTVNISMGRLLITSSSPWLLSVVIRYISVVLIPALLLGACGEGSQNPVTKVSENAAENVSNAKPAMLEKGMYFKPDLSEYAMHNEHDADGDGDGVNETHVQRYINSKGDTVFSMTTGDRLWAWSLDTQGGDANDIHKNYVIRDSNCDGVFDERYSLTAEYHVPGCLAREGAAETLDGV